MPADVEDMVLSTLGNETRREILKLIKKNPNITYTDIMKTMKLDTGTLNYHLSKMSEFITKSDNKYRLSKLGHLAVDTIDFLHSQTILSKEHAYFLFNNFVMMRLSDIFLALFRPKLAFKKITESRVRNYFPLAFTIFLLANLMSILIVILNGVGINGANISLGIGSNMITLVLLLVFLPVLIVKTAEILWQNRKSYLDVATLLMISYVPGFVYNLLYLFSYLPFLSDVKSMIVAQLLSTSILNIPLSMWTNILTSLLLLIWVVYLFFTSIRVYFELSKGQTLVILVFSGVLYFLLETAIILVLTLSFIVVTT